MRWITILVVLLSLAVPVSADVRPLTVFTANNLGRADLLPNDTAQVIIELRSETAQAASIQHLAPEGLILEHAAASAGALATTPFVSWTGEVSATQPINLVLTYRVNEDAQAGDRLITAQAQINGHYQYAESVLRICCVSAPPAQYHGHRLFLPAVRA